MKKNIIYDNIDIKSPFNYYPILEKIEYANRISFPKEYYCSIYLNKLKRVNNLSLPLNLYGDLDLYSYLYVDELNLPQYVSGYVDLSSLKTTNGLVLPRETGNLYLGLESPKNVLFPDRINGYIFAFNFNDLEGLKLPKSFDLNNLYTDLKLKQEVLDNPSKYIRNEISLVMKKSE